MTYYSVLDVTPTDDSWIPDYLPVANAGVAAYGGRYLARTATHEQVEGDAQPAGVRIIIEWPSREAALAFMADKDYAPHLARRLQNSVGHHYLIAAQDDMA